MKQPWKVYISLPLDLQFQLVEDYYGHSSYIVWNHDNDFYQYVIKLLKVGCIIFD